MDNNIYWLPTVGSTKPTLCLTVGSGILMYESPLHKEILDAKNEIDGVTPAGYWDDAKKITNPYEFVFLSLQKRNQWSLAGLIPLSRSYFKLVEIWMALGLTDSPLKTAHTAEGPGGFLEAIQHRTRHSSRMTAMTLRSTDRAIPGWRKSQQFLISHPTVHVSYGADGTGNLYSLENQAAFKAVTETHLGGKAMLYTADGGFDFSANFNGQENTVQRLLAAELLAGLHVLDVGGTLVIKLFDMKNRATLEMIWALSSCFERTGLMKPKTSRPANSERYWIGVGFCGEVDWLVSMLEKMTTTDTSVGWNQIFSDSLLTDDWVASVCEFQKQVEEHQLVNIRKTLDIIQRPTREAIRQLLLENIQQSRQWCIAHNIPINEKYTGMSDEEITSLNLEEVLAPFQVSVGHTNSPGSSRPSQRHRVLTSAPVQQPPTGLAWRTALPASVLGRSPSQTGGETPGPTGPPRPQSVRGNDRQPGQP